MKHINVKFHFVREKIVEKEICVKKIATKDNPADIMKKSLKGESLKKHTEFLNILNTQRTRLYSRVVSD